MNLSIIYGRDEDHGGHYPIWMFVDAEPGRPWDWNETLYIDFMNTFDRLTTDNLDYDVVSLTVPSDSYVRPADRPNHFGIHMLQLLKHLRHLERQSSVRVDPSEIRRLNLRILDVEEVMNFDARHQFAWQ